MLSFLNTYSLIDFIPIEPSVYLRLFERINAALWPLPLLTITVGILAMTVMIRCQQEKIWHKLSWGILAVSWWLVGYQFHFNLLSELNWVGNYFFAFFVVQGLLLLFVDFFAESKGNSKESFFEKKLGIVMMAFGIVLYPLISGLTDRSWQSAEIFGIAPDPTCLATLGALLVTCRCRWWLLIIPITWCLISGAMGYGMGLSTGLLLFFSGILVLLARALRGLPKHGWPKLWR